MKNIIMTIIFLSAIGSTVPVLAQIQSNQNVSQNRPDAAIRGTVVAVDSGTQTITVTDYITGGDRTFTVARKEDLNNLKSGDKVNIVPQQGNSNEASRIQKS